MTSNFAFLPSEFRAIAESATKAEGYIVGDPRTACFHARFALESIVHWLYRHDSGLRMPYDQSLGALLYEPTFQNLLPEAVFQKARVIQKVGNQAVHSSREVRQFDALQVVKELHHLCYWLVRTYAPNAPRDGAAWRDDRIPKPPASGQLVPRRELESLERKLAEQNQAALKQQQVDLKFPREGIEYAKLSEAERAQWESLDWGDDTDTGALPDKVNAAAINNWLFNKNTVDLVLQHLMEHGHKVDGGDRLAKTILFARNHEHATFIEQRFNHHYPHYAGHFARVIDIVIHRLRTNQPCMNHPSAIFTLAAPMNCLQERKT